ncbi:MAG: hypothetical protein ACTHW2_03970 [Tissierella sp.]|uniref:hypothetical protein n=1 Tax=Tissierella sp. TaxID=41274 RepID=UPI003F9C396D
MFSTINRDHLMGAAVGVGACAVGYYLYTKNEEQVDNFLKKQGINLPTSTSKNYNNMSIEELMETKELLEDLIAEKEVKMSSETIVSSEEV